MPSIISTNGLYAKIRRKDVSQERPLPSPQAQTDMQHNKSSYTAPVIMLSALTVGLATALAQHFMYAALDGKPLSNVSVSQAWIFRFSTGLAFLAKLALTICVGSAFIQHQWLLFQRESFRIVEIDTLTSALGNILCLCESTVWLRYPLLTLMALTSWTIPLSAIVTPGPLSVEPARNITSMSLQVPQPSFRGMNYGSASSFGPGGLVRHGNGEVTRLMIQTAASHGPVQLQSTYQNETYHLSFHGPALQCRSANDSLIRNMTSQFGYGEFNPPGKMVQFASWVGGDQGALTGADTVGSVLFNSPFTTLDETSVDAARIFVMTNTGTWNKTLTMPVAELSNMPLPIRVVNMTECLLFNATYEMDFTFRYPNQTHSLRVTQWLNPVNARSDSYYDDSFEYASTDHGSYAAMMSQHGRLLVGVSQVIKYDNTINSGTSWNIVNIDWSQAEAVQRGLEQLLQNFTSSLMSDSGLIKDSSTAKFVPVAVETWPITYAYSRQDLFIAYGLSLLATLLCALVGIRAFLINKASYQNMFSTYLRSTQNAWLSRYILSTDVGDVKIQLSELALKDEDAEMSSTYEERTRG